MKFPAERTISVNLTEGQVNFSTSRCGRARKLLVAGSDRDQLFGISELLTRDDYDVSQAVNGFQALQMARELQPEVMLIDDSLQGIGALDLCGQLKADPQSRDVKVILLASDPDKGQATADRCLGKPSDGAEVARTVEELLE